ncbi:uncharacterized protein K460DRAFT_277296 [Cucurbitaria berberidis CBS 394.84]|uniref:Uncharacterized protein n=1 Tax=Cucurbitaria berberidis CBS 394.84 TaxID=1168544 RepID=A0A9P4GN70_9PLEO|nr:uncharacterized protein K460DRAFT_277296 [Cucurbitaria berberidis CBS 394.84]KAF1848126.1 hypothetical protein K460DRAFT_277296 [Cucurbitaria berberidis CBS 394.84]
MANSDDNNPRRDPNRPEDNPFIAFRRFADSQVSSLLNTVFTLPATISNYNYAHQAREQCLFGKADERQCDKLHELEAEITELRHEGRELFRRGDIQAVLRNSEELMRSDRRADELRRDIVDTAASTQRGEIVGHNDRELVERVANEKGQEWGWSWDWGFPKPFDHDENASRAMTEEDAARQARQIELMLQLQSEVKKLVGESTYDDAMAAPRVWSWSRSWQWPPPAEASRPNDSAYSPRVLEEDQEMKKSGVQWQKAYEDLLRAERNERPHCMRSDEPVFPQHRGRRSLFLDLDGRSGEGKPLSESKWVARRGLEEEEDEPSYEYAHDHEDQHDDPPSPKVQKVLEQDAQKPSQAWQSEERETQTEMDAYEQLLASKEQPSTSPAYLNSGTAKSSILSTLTSTERTVAPDGSVTTKVVLKKRFADGREESSESVRTQHGQEDNALAKDSWKDMPNVQTPSIEKDISKKTERGRGWFWSS